jgi:hypothetical protein
MTKLRWNVDLGNGKEMDSLWKLNSYSLVMLLSTIYHRGEEFLGHTFLNIEF